MENKLEERDAVDWLTDDEMMRQWEEVSEDEEEITAKRCDGGKPQAEQVRSAPELVVAQTQMRKEKQEQKKKRQITGWSTKML